LLYTIQFKACCKSANFKLAVYQPISSLLYISQFQVSYILANIQPAVYQPISGLLYISQFQACSTLVIFNLAVYQSISSLLTGPPREIVQGGTKLLLGPRVKIEDLRSNKTTGTFS
jgi:hypothetical protein